MKPGRVASPCNASSKAQGLDCRVIAPAPILQQPGNRVKTDRRDARQLARLLRADLLTAVTSVSAQNGLGSGLGSPHRMTTEIRTTGESTSVARAGVEAPFCPRDHAVLSQNSQSCE